MVRPRKSEFTTSLPQMKQRKLALLKVPRKFFKSSPHWPWAFWCWPYAHSRVNYLWPREGWLWRKGTEGSSQDQKWGKSEACIKIRVLLSQEQEVQRHCTGNLTPTWRVNKCFPMNPNREVGMISRNWQHRRVLHVDGILDGGTEVKTEFSKIKNLKGFPCGESREYRVE